MCWVLFYVYSDIEFSVQNTVSCHIHSGLPMLGTLGSSADARHCIEEQLDKTNELSLAEDNLESSQKQLNAAMDYFDKLKPLHYLYIMFVRCLSNCASIRN